ncbi:hypothetical protein [Chryseobacterium taklimakanense]|uniref:hypothetical protein n=1 Tax=Chryseobacterium taklimakanense TaxID=536441 RepID=UPI001E435BFA|nr:hypothetical protein [Chryseobacterium taklimakanense]
MYTCTPQSKFIKITLKQKLLADGRVSLYLEFYKGSTTDNNGKRTHLRDFEYLKMYLFGNPKTANLMNNREKIIIFEK